MIICWSNDHLMSRLIDWLWSLLSIFDDYLFDCLIMIVYNYDFKLLWWSCLSPHLRSHVPMSPYTGMGSLFAENIYCAIWIYLKVFVHIFKWVSLTTWIYKYIWRRKIHLKSQASPRSEMRTCPGTSKVIIMSSYVIITKLSHMVIIIVAKLSSCRHRRKTMMIHHHHHSSSSSSSSWSSS